MSFMQVVVSTAMHVYCSEAWLVYFFSCATCSLYYGAALLGSRSNLPECKIDLHQNAPGWLALVASVSFMVQ